MPVLLSRWTALQVAASVGANTCVSVLLASGASHSRRDKLDRTALHLAVTAGEVGVPSGKLLLEGGADAYVEDSSGVRTRM